LIDGGPELVLIDTGAGAGVEAILNNIRGFGLDPNKLKYTINTHCHFDHSGGNKMIKELTETKIAVHSSEADVLETLESELILVEMAKKRGLKLEPVKVDLRLNDEDTLRVGKYELKIIHTPGHTPGCISIAMRIKENTILFSGDIVSAQGRLNFINGPGFNLNEWKNSLERLRDLNVDLLFPGHGTFLLSGASNHIKLYLDKMSSPWRNIVTPLDFG
jgi:glyoxylase-like metal-dependent hydrolase (beta-lactamase superfamily II)